MKHHQHEHRTGRIGWLRPAVLGANDGIVSTASLLLGVAAAHASHSGLVVAGVAGLVAGAMSMAAGEYVSVRSQTDTEEAEVEVERRHLQTDPEFELQELQAIYVKRGLTKALASEVAGQLMKHDALGAHIRDELGISETLQPRPIQAATASALSFAAGGILPVIVVVVAPEHYLFALLAATSLVFLAALGALAAWAGGANVVTGATRVTFWGALAMALTAGVGLLFNAV